MFISTSILYLYLYYTDILYWYLYIDISMYWYIYISLSLYIVHIHILYLYSYKAYKPPYFSAWWPPKSLGPLGGGEPGLLNYCTGGGSTVKKSGSQWRNRAHGGDSVELEMGISSQFARDFHGNHQRSHGGCNGISMGRGLVDWITPMSCHWLATGVILDYIL